MEAVTLNEDNPSRPPLGFKLRCTLQGHQDIITQLAWSPDGKQLASASKDHTIRLWNAETGELCSILEGHSDEVVGVAWSLNENTLASVSTDHTIRLWNAKNGKLRSTIEDQYCHSIACSPDGKVFATGYSDYIREIEFWNTQTGEKYKITRSDKEKEKFIRIQERYRLSKIFDQQRFTEKKRLSFAPLINFIDYGSLAWSPDNKIIALADNTHQISLYNLELIHRSLVPEVDSSKVLGLAWSPDNQILASAILDGTIRLWNSKTETQIQILEGHADAVTGVSFSFDGHFLASRSLDDSVRIWRTDTWETVAVLYEPTSSKWRSDVTFNPKLPILATLGEKDTVIHLWELDFSYLLSKTPVTSSVHYINAKVVLVGDTSVGKSGLALVLSGDDFIPTESTHGRHVWTFDKRGGFVAEGNRAQTSETLLWDLAGQPGYRLIHQLHLNEIAVALVVFDSRSETDPFAGVRHWDRALRQAQRLQGSNAVPIKKFLVAARADRGGVGVSRARIDLWLSELEFNGFFETSSKEGWQISELADAIRNAINWEALPSVASTKLFQRIKDFLIAEKKAERLLSTVDDLYRAFLSSEEAPPETEKLKAQFETCIGRVESRGLIRRLSFANYILLQPELLDAYASALINAAKDEPDGLGNIAEEDARYGRFRMSEKERVQDKAQEELLLISTIEELLHHELALREPADDGSYLIFPSQFTREWPDAPDPQGKAVIFEFEGPILNIYATLAVRLARSGLFIKKELWKNASTYNAKVGGLCGMFLREVQEGKGELTLFFDENASEQTRFQFEDYIHIHLKRRSLPTSIKRRRIFACPECEDVTIPERHVQLRRDRGFNWISCSVCETRISLLDQEQRLTATSISVITEIDVAADLQRTRDTTNSTLQGKKATKDFDVFLCHNSEDKQAIKQIGEQLKELGILPWLDEWELRPGLPWQKALEQQIKYIKSAAVFIGENSIGPWQNAEINAFLREFISRNCPVIPVLLSNAPKEPELPIFLRGITWVDFRKSEPDPMNQLLWGITGKR